VSVTIVTATGIEARAARRAMPRTRVVEVGMGLSRYGGEPFETAIVCGVAGGLRRGVPTGTVVVASEVARHDGTVVATDAALRKALERGARACGFEPLVAPVLTTQTIVAGGERRRWADRGFAAADMESAGVVADRLAVVRVILDTPERELSTEWLRPLHAVFQPRLWGELQWLARHAPHCARASAIVARAGLLLANE
jgi:uridine phosphorylase